MKTLFAKNSIPADTLSNEEKLSPDYTIDKIEQNTPIEVIAKLISDELIHIVKVKFGELQKHPKSTSNS